MTMWKKLEQKVETFRKRRAWRKVTRKSGKKLEKERMEGDKKRKKL